MPTGKKQKVGFPNASDRDDLFYSLLNMFLQEDKYAVPTHVLTNAARFELMPAIYGCSQLPSGKWQVHVVEDLEPPALADAAFMVLKYTRGTVSRYVLGGRPGGTIRHRDTTSTVDPNLEAPKTAFDDADIRGYAALILVAAQSCSEDVDDATVCECFQAAFERVNFMSS